MEIKLTPTQSKELLGNLMFIGGQPKFKYDRDTKKKTAEIEGTILELASEKLGKTINIISEEKNLDLPAFTVVELTDLKYIPYAKAVSQNFAELVERFTCSQVTAIKGGLN